jgi:hypothetical protein
VRFKTPTQVSKRTRSTISTTPSKRPRSHGSQSLPHIATKTIIMFTLLLLTSRCTATPDSTSLVPFTRTRSLQITPRAMITPLFALYPPQQLLWRSSPHSNGDTERTMRNDHQRCRSPVKVYLVVRPYLPPFQVVVILTFRTENSPYG